MEASNSQEVIDIDCMDISDTELIARTRNSTLFRGLSHQDNESCEVVIKLRELTMDGQSRLRNVIARGNRILCGLRHPNIVTGYAHWCHENTCGLIMEYLEGADLGVVPDLNCQQLSIVGAQIASALQKLDEMCIMHGDVRRSNIFLARSGVAKLIDFDLARHITEESYGYGGLHYLAPEQFDGKQTPRSDLFSLGVCLYLFLVGDYPPRADVSAVPIRNVLQGTLEDAVRARSADLNCGGCESYFKGDCKWVVDLIPGLLADDPKNRLCTSSMLAHGKWQGGGHIPIRLSSDA